MESAPASLGSVMGVSSSHLLEGKRQVTNVKLEQRPYHVWMVYVHVATFCGIVTAKMKKYKEVKVKFINMWTESRISDPLLPMLNP